jgi:hypothetical protein
VICRTNTRDSSADDDHIKVDVFFHHTGETDCKLLHVVGHET